MEADLILTLFSFERAVCKKHETRSLKQEKRKTFSFCAAVFSVQEARGDQKGTIKKAFCLS